jgi:hypothetical protein
MAITITDQPTNFAKVGQKLMVVATSTNVGQPNFRYVVRVTNITDSADLPEVIVPPNPQNVLMFDLSQIIKPEVHLSVYETSSNTNYITESTLISAYTSMRNCQLLCEIKVLEAYDVAGVFTINEASVVTLESADGVSLFNFINAAYTVADGYKPNPNLTYAYNSTTSLLMGSRKPNTNYPSNLAGATPSSQRVFIPVRKSELDWGTLPLIYQAAANICLEDATINAVVRMTLYESDGTPNTVSDVSLFYADGSSELIFLTVYPANLNAHGVLLRPADFPNWRWYEIAMYDSTNTTRVSAAYTFYPVDDDCTFDNVRLAWWDDVVGGFDFFNFQRKNEITMEVERKRIKPVVGTYDAATFSFNTFDAEIKEGMIDAVDYLEVTSGWIQEGEFELLKHLVKSEMVYICQDSGQLVPVVMETNSFTVNKERNAKLKSVSFRLRIAQQNIQ